MHLALSYACYLKLHGIDIWIKIQVTIPLIVILTLIISSLENDLFPFELINCHMIVILVQIKGTMNEFAVD